MSMLDDDAPDSAARDITIDITQGPRPARTRPGAGRPAGRTALAWIGGFVILIVAAAAWISVDRTDGDRNDAAEQVPAAATPLPMPSTAIASPPTAAPALEPTPPTAAAMQPPSLGVTPIAFVPWPAPPKDHDPTVSGVPASLPANLSPGQAILYVNDLGRPTLLDLASGDRSEVTIATTRLEDSFLVDHGHVVTRRSGHSTLRQASDGALSVSIHQSGRDPAATIAVAATPGPQLCLGAGGCPELRWTTGSFGTDSDRIESAGSATDLTDSTDSTDSVGTIGQLLGASSWVPGPRWTVYRFGDIGEDVQVPTPLAGATVWIVAQASASP